MRTIVYNKKKTAIPRIIAMIKEITIRMPQTTVVQKAVTKNTYILAIMPMTIERM